LAVRGSSVAFDGKQRSAMGPTTPTKGLARPLALQSCTGDLDISRNQVWPNGAIELIALLYKVCFRVEQMSGEFKVYICQYFTPGHMIGTVWEHLQRENPELRKEFILDQTGPTHSGQVITATIQRIEVWQNVYFQVFQNGWIRYENRDIWNVWTPEEVWHHFAQEDGRILPFEAYEVQDRRPWEPYGNIESKLKSGDVPDTTENGCGSAGGMVAIGHFQEGKGNWWTENHQEQIVRRISKVRMITSWRKLITQSRAQVDRFTSS
jgi:hypothetical protein